MRGTLICGLTIAVASGLVGQTPVATSVRDSTKTSDSIQQNSSYVTVSVIKSIAGERPENEFFELRFKFNYQRRVFGLASLVRGRSLLRLASTVQGGIVRDFVGHLVDLPYSFFQSRSTGDLMMRAGSMGVIRETVTTATLSAAVDGFLALAYLAVLVRLDASLGVLAAACVLGEVAVLASSWRSLAEHSAEMTDREARSQGYLAQMLFGIRTLKVAGAEQRALRQWSELFDQHLEAQERRGRVATLVDAGLATIQSGAHKNITRIDRSGPEGQIDGLSGMNADARHGGLRPKRCLPAKFHA